MDPSSKVRSQSHLYPPMPCPAGQSVQTAALLHAPGSQPQYSHQNTASAQPYSQPPHPPLPTQSSHPSSSAYRKSFPVQPAPSSEAYPQSAYSMNVKSPIENPNGPQAQYQLQQSSPGYFQPPLPQHNPPQYGPGTDYPPNQPGRWNTRPPPVGSNSASSFPLPFGGSSSITTQAFTAIVGAQAFKPDEMFRLVSWPVMKLRPYFQVTNSYVSKKLSILLFPFGHKSWQRIQASSGSQLAMPGSVPVYSANGPPNGDANTYTSVPVLYALPREDSNAPDLYIPTMAFVTYVVLVGIISGMDGKFQPDVLGVTASSAFVMSLVELLIIKLGCYLLSFGNEVALLDVLAYVGYKYVGLDLTLLAGLAYPGLGAICIWLYTGLAFALFLLRSLRHAILPDSPTGFYQEQRRKRIHFLIIIAALQLVFSYFLIVEPAATPSLIKPPSPVDELPWPPGTASNKKKSSSKAKTRKRPSSPIFPDEKEALISEGDEEGVKVKVERRQ